MAATTNELILSELKYLSVVLLYGRPKRGRLSLFNIIPQYQ